METTSFDDEIDMAAKFLEELEGISIHLDREDKWIWKEDVIGGMVFVGIL